MYPSYWWQSPEAKIRYTKSQSVTQPVQSAKCSAILHIRSVYSSSLPSQVTHPFTFDFIHHIFDTTPLNQLIVIIKPYSPYFSIHLGCVHTLQIQGTAFC